MTMKRFYFFVMMLCSSVSLFAQATDLVIDNQTPGWLSSKINYGDQMTVKNLKVTGYINEADLKFLGTLIQNRNLYGRLDLSDANKIAETTKESDNEFKGNVFGLSEQKSIEYFSFPKSTTSISNFNANLTIDTLVVNTNMTIFSQDCLLSDCNHLIIGENITTIGAGCGYRINSSIDLPQSVKKISAGAFYNKFVNLQKVNLIKQKTFPNLEYIGWCAFREMKQDGGVEENHSETLPDTLYFPNIKTFNINAFEYKKGMHIFLGDKIEKFTYSDVAYSANRAVSLKDVYFHINKTNGITLSSDLISATIYIPKGSLDNWKSSFNNVTFIEEERPLEAITIDKNEIAMEIGEKTQLSVSFTPADADDKSIVWSIEDPAIASVNEEGLVTALSPGKTIVTVKSVPTGIQASCEIVVLQHVTGVSMSVPSLEMTKIGETHQLDVTVAPENATDKSVKWTSSNPSVCTVTESGNVIALGYGTAIVIATTTDGSFPATCVVNVIQPVTIKAKNATRTYGEANPTFEYSSEGAELVGTPVITCEATETSPVGEYPIVVTKGSVTNSNDSYVNGTLTITKAPLKVSVGNYSRTKGEDNPEFTIDYDWFKNGDDVSVLLTKPTAYTTATKDSEAGEYPIYISGGDAQNYELFYTDGVLTVIASTGIDSVVSSESKVFDVYSIGGTKVRSKISTLDNLPKGVYIVNGKKLVVK